MWGMSERNPIKRLIPFMKSELWGVLSLPLIFMFGITHYKHPLSTCRKWHHSHMFATFRGHHIANPNSAQNLWGKSLKNCHVFAACLIPPKMGKFSVGIFRDPQEWDPLPILVPYHFDKNPGIVWVALTIKGSHVLGSPWNHPWNLITLP